MFMKLSSLGRAASGFPLGGGKDGEMGRGMGYMGYPEAKVRGTS